MSIFRIAVSQRDWLALILVALCLYPNHVLAQGKIEDLLTRDRCEPRSSISDLVQSLLEKELRETGSKFRASAGWALISNVRTGEVLAYSEFGNIHRPAIPWTKDWTKDKEPRSPELRSLVIAVGLDVGAFTLTDSIDLRKVADFGRRATLQEAFTFPPGSGISLYLQQRRSKFETVFRERLSRAHERLEAGVAHPADKVLLGIPPINIGYGLSVPPIELLAVSAAAVNGGQLLPLSFVKTPLAGCARAEPASFIQPETSAAMRSLLKRNAEVGSVRKSNTRVVSVGGEAGVIAGDQGLAINIFLGAFPIDKPEHQLFVGLKEAKGIPDTFGFIAPSWNVVPLAGKLIEKLNPLLVKVIPAGAVDAP